jgi:triosephosphate isomerase
LNWLAELRDELDQVPSISSGRVEFFVAPSTLQLVDAIRIFSDSPVGVCSQDVSAFGIGPYTGEVVASELSDIGVRYAEIGHAERRSLLGESDELVATKVASAVEHNLVPVLCVGEPDQVEPERAADLVCEQVRMNLSEAGPGRVIIAYEPIWAIGAAAPAPTDHIAHVTQDIRSFLDSMHSRQGSSVIYGGSAGPGLVKSIDSSVDGLFLGRFGHNIRNVIQVIDEVSQISETSRESRIFLTSPTRHDIVRGTKQEP